MDHQEVIKLSKKVDTNGSIILSSRYTPILDLYFEEVTSEDEDSGSSSSSSSSHQNHTYNSGSNSNGGTAQQGGQKRGQTAVVNQNQNSYQSYASYSFDGNTIKVGSAWVPFRTLQITRVQGCYQLVVGFFGGGRLISEFLEKALKYSFTEPHLVLFSHTHQNSQSVIQNNNLNNRYKKAPNNKSMLEAWTPSYHLEKLSNVTPLARVAQLIVDRFMMFKRYPVMVFNADPQTKKLLPHYVQYVLLSQYKKAGHLWLDIDLRDTNLDLVNDVLSEVSMDLPSIATYRNMLDVYKDAMAGSAKTIAAPPINLDNMNNIDNMSDADNMNSVNSVNSGNLGNSLLMGTRYSENKHTLNNFLDKLGDTFGAISIMFCDCADVNALSEIAKRSNNTTVQIQSFYRKGRVDGEITMSVELRDETGIRFPYIHFYDKETSDEVKIAMLNL